MLMPAMCHQLGIFLDYEKVVLVFHYCFDIQSLLWRTGLTVGDGSHLVQYLYQIWSCAWMFPFNILSLMFWRRVPNLGAPFLKLSIFPLVVHYCETHCIDLQKLVCHETWENCFILLFCLLPTSTHTVSYKHWSVICKLIPNQLEKIWKWLGNHGVYHLPQQLKENCETSWSQRK